MTTKTVVTVNCAGTYIQTYRDTLIRGSTYFKALFQGGFSESLEVELPPDNVTPSYDVFLDMRPEWFKLLLDRMRYGTAYDLPKKHKGLRLAAEFLGVEYRNADEIEREQAAQKDLDKQARLVSLKEAGKVGFLVMCLDEVNRKCLARVVDVDDTKNQYLIHYQHWDDRYDEWIAKDSPRISRNIGRCECKSSRCPDLPQGNTYVTTTTIPTSQSYFINYLNGAATTSTRHVL